MKLRPKMLWRVPVFCTAASWLTYYIHVYLGGFFFTVRIQGADGAVALSADPVRSAVFTGVLFLAALLGGAAGCWAGMYLFRHKTRHWYFAAGMPLILACQVALAVWLCR